MISKPTYITSVIAFFCMFFLLAPTLAVSDECNAGLITGIKSKNLNLYKKSGNKLKLVKKRSKSKAMKDGEITICEKLNNEKILEIKLGEKKWLVKARQVTIGREITLAGGSCVKIAKAGVSSTRGAGECSE